ncbi:MAG: tetratricopeptide repeat protein [Gammaproteobacteria bacterium]
MKYFTLLIVLLAAGCASVTDTDYAAADLAAGAESVPADVDYHLLMAEIALQRNENGVAATEYLAAALAGDDLEVAARAARVAFAYGTPEEGLKAARRWAALDPDAREPRALLVRLYLDQSRVGPAVDHMAFLYDAAPTDERPFSLLLPVVSDSADPAAALEAVETLAARHPADPSAWYAVGSLSLREGNLDRALEASLKAAELDPDWPQAASLHARALAADGRSGEALAWLDQRPDADSPALRLERAILLMAADRTDEARRLLESLVTEEPGNAVARRALGYLEFSEGNMDDARRHFMALMATGRFPDDAVFYLGSIAEQEGDLHEAVRMYSRVSGGQHLVTAQVRLALLMYRMGRPQLALQHLEEFGRLNPRAEVELSTARAELLARMGDTDAALQAYDELIAAHPEADEALYARALLYERLDRVDEALADMRELLRRRPDDPTFLNALGYTLADRTERYDEAYDLVRRAYEQAPDSPAVVDSMGWVLFRLGRHEEALEYLRRAWDLERDPEIAAHLGEVLWDMGRADEARDVWTDAIVDFPDSEVLRETMRRLDPS